MGSSSPASADVAGLASWPGAAEVLVAVGQGVCTTTRTGSSLRSLLHCRIRDAVGAEGTERFELPAVMPAEVTERADYLAGFPHLLGAVRAFDGDRRSHLALLESVRAGQDWSAHLAATRLVLPPAACHGIYHLWAGRDTDGFSAEIRGRCFRHEPSSEATRLQAFEMLEFVSVGTAEEVITFAERGLDAAESVLRSFGLSVERTVAHDPFFGVGATMLAAEQEANQAKTELVASVAGCTFAVASVNRHGNHFGDAFGITCSGELAHSSCVAFGIERLMLALVASDDPASAALLDQARAVR